MKLFSQLFFAFSSVVGTVSVAAEPSAACANGLGKYDPAACNFCATLGNGHGQCCEAILTHSFGCNDDDSYGLTHSLSDCVDLNGDCIVGRKSCYPGLTCGPPGTKYTMDLSTKKCQLKENDPNAHAAAALVASSSSTGATTGGPSFVLVVVGLLGAAMMALTVVVPRRHRAPPPLPIQCGGCYDGNSH